MFYRFLFQESYIFDGGGERPNPDGRVEIVNAKSEGRARRKLPETRLGVKWILVGKEAK